MEKSEKIEALLHSEHYTFGDLVDIVEILRAPGGCPWDREQTHASIRKDLIEETYEVIEAIDKNDAVLLREELGDVMLQVVFHAQIEREEGRFDINDVANDVCAKLIHRHPHVFGSVKAETSEKVLENWEEIKGEEKSRVTVTDKLVAIPPMLPGLMRAAKVGKKAACFDFSDEYEVMLKVEEELSEVSEAIDEGDPEHVEEEIGDLLFTMASLARKCHVDPEEALTRATDKFIDRFAKLEKEVISRGLDINDLKMPDLDKIWEEIKQKNRK